MKRIEAKVSSARKQNDNITLCRYLGYDSKVEAVYTERVTAAIENDDSMYTFNRGVRQLVVAR